MLAYDDTVGGACPKCTIEDAEAPVPRGGATTGESEAARGQSGGDDDDRRKKKQIVGAFLISSGFALQLEAARHLKECLEAVEASSFLGLELVWARTACLDLVKSAALGGFLQAAGGSVFLPKRPPKKDETKCGRRDARSPSDPNEKSRRNCTRPVA